MSQDAPKQKLIMPLAMAFTFSTGFLVAVPGLLARINASQTVLLIGNIILFAITLTSLLIHQRGTKAANPQAFVRSVYAGIMIKLFACMIAAAAYILSARANVNKPALFGCMFLYVLYTVIEVRSLQKSIRQQKNA
jgi:hypothetical protein